MMPGIKGRTAVVGGSSSGLGFATAEHLARFGARVMVVSRSEDRVGLAVEKIRADTGGAVEGCVADFNDDDAPMVVVEAARAAFGPPEIVVANAGGPPGANDCVKAPAGSPATRRLATPR